MSILFVLLTFLIIISISYFMRHGQLPLEEAEHAKTSLPAMNPVMIRESGFEVPKGFCFHPGHTWACDEGRQNARMGIDSFAASLFGRIDKIEVAGLNRWVRQGQKLCTITRDGVTAEFLSPVEGVVVAVNHDALRDPSLVTKDPYNSGWICVIKAPEMEVNLKNLLQGGMISTWMQNSVRRLQSYAAPLGAATADGGLPVEGLLAKLEPSVQRSLVREFFLN
ncbi:MAG TPA: glycine cleavage system protein H [Terriglobales bacterium]|nr:glycine cleavage system protein H [Terriglobales bacterium]